MTVVLSCNFQRIIRWPEHFEGVRIVGGVSGILDTLDAFSY